MSTIGPAATLRRRRRRSRGTEPPYAPESWFHATAQAERALARHRRAHLAPNPRPSRDCPTRAPPALRRRCVPHRPMALIALSFPPDPSPHTSRLLSCPLNRALLRWSGHLRRLLSMIRVCTLQCDTVRRRFRSLRAAVMAMGSGAPCTLPRSSTGVGPQGLGPSRRMSASDSRGIVTGTPAWSGRPATGKISCFPPSLVCTSSPSALCGSPSLRRSAAAVIVWVGHHA